jgi:hypothetical protein
MSESWVNYGLIALDPTDTEKWVRKDIHEGERRLMVAVLKNAIECFQKHASARGLGEEELFRKEEEWFFSRKDRKEHLSFGYICEALELDPDYIRRGLLLWKQSARCRSRVNRIECPRLSRRKPGPALFKKDLL